MKYQDLKTVITSQFSKTNGITYLILGKPGGGKSALCRDVGNTLGFENIIEFNASLRDPVDLLGTPRNDSEVTTWKPPAEIKALETGRNLLILEELTDANAAMQNALCGLIYDRRIGNVHLSSDTYILASGNRTQDKSGANKLSTKLGNRVRIKEFDENIDDWCSWALEAGIDPVMIQFLRFKPNLLSDFDPNRSKNPTPRAWARANEVPADLPTDLYFDEIASDVGEGAAAEYTGFRRIYENLPNVDVLLMNPAKAEVPSDPAVLYALTGALAHRATKDNFDRVYEYVSRLPKDFGVMLINDAVKLKPEVKTTKAFVKWAVENANVLL